MAERPIILFGEPTPAKKAPEDPKFPRVQLPTHARQVARLTPKMDALKYDKKTKTSFRNDKKTNIGGKIYCMLTSTKALLNLLSLWENYKKDANMQFPKKCTGFRKVFECLHDIRRWGYMERIEETGILEAWNEDLQLVEVNIVRCEIEIFFSKSHDVRTRREEDVSAKVASLGGAIISSSTIIDINYHAVLADLPRTAVKTIIRDKEAVALVAAEQIMFFRPVGQSVFVSDGIEATLVSINVDEIIDEPVVAVFDGFPMANHPYLNNRLMIDDPDNYEQNYVVEARKHGTAMTSLVALGDLSKENLNQATRKIYVRPIMQPRLSHDNKWFEEIPSDILLVDKIHEAVRRLFVSEAGAFAPTVKIINLSIGIETRQFDRVMSPLARLLDWLSYTYRVLFVVSSGDHYPHKGEWNTNVPFDEFSTSDENVRDDKVINWIADNAWNLRLLSPAESMNALTVGALFDDEAQFADIPQHFLPCSDKMLSPISAIGKGINSSVKPDIVYPGGRNVVRECIANNNAVTWRGYGAQGAPGMQSAAPFTPGNPAKTVYTFGTSNAAALISHEASRCYDALLDVFDSTNRELPTEYVALMLKAMLIHGAEWESLKTQLTEALGLHNRKQYPDVLHKFIGYGKPEIDKAIECAKKRISLIGYGELNDGEAHLYELPLPFDFHSDNITRRLTVTLAYFTPIAPKRQEYRAAKLWFDVQDDKKHLIDSRVDASDTAVERGSVQLDTPHG